MRLARGLGIPECPTSALSRHIPEKRFEMAILQAPQFYHVPSFTRSPGSMPLDFCSWQSGCRAASPRAHGDCGPAGLVGHFSHQLPETPPSRQPRALSKDMPRLRDNRSGTFCSGVVGRTGVEDASPRGDCMEMPCQCVTLLGEGSRVNSHCPVLCAAVARYTGLFGQLPCLSVCLGDAG